MADTRYEGIVMVSGSRVCLNERDVAFAGG